MQFNAEQLKLDQICGIGYRKALEFLLKDFLIKEHPDKKEEIQKKLLGRCIKEYIENPNLMDVAKRAAWLGNDQAHYFKK